MQELGHDERIKGRQRDGYFGRPYMVVEMHRDLVEVDYEYSLYYEIIWEHVKLDDVSQYVNELFLEDGLIYTFIHLVRYFREDKIGISFVMDIYVYSHLKGTD